MSIKIFCQQDAIYTHVQIPMEINQGGSCPIGGCSIMKYNITQLHLHNWNPRVLQYLAMIL